MDRFVVKKSRLELSSASESSDGNATVTLSSDSMDVATSGAQGGPSTVRSETGKTSTLPVKCPSKVSLRPFKREWLGKYAWLFYDDTEDKAFCTICRQANEKNFLVAFRLLRKLLLLNVSSTVCWRD